jgi:hypothetical protein
MGNIERRIYVCPVHGEVMDVVGMGRDRAPLHAFQNCGQEVEVVDLVPDSQPQDQRARINAAFAGVKSGELSACREQLRGAVEALRELDAWASRMPDAGFTSDDPRWDWWHERPRPDLGGR